MLNLVTSLERNAHLTPDKIAIYFADKSFSYAELDAYACRIANGLQKLGIQPGDKVALSCPNLPYFPMVYYGILKAGGVVVPLNILFKPAEISYHLSDCEARAYLCFEGSDELPIGPRGWEAFNDATSCEHFVMITADPAQPASEDTVATLGQLIFDQPGTFDSVQTSTTDSAVILYTSGTTGQPKGAELSHSNLAMNAMACQILKQLTGNDVELITLPLFHTMGQTVQMNTTIQAGGSIVLIPKFDPDVVLAAMEKHAVTVFAGVPTMYIALLNHPAADQYDLAAIASNLRVAISGGASIQVEVLKQFEQKFDVPVLEGYGLSETSPVVCFTHLEFDRVPGSIGQPIVGVDVKIVDTDGATAALGKPGELVVKGHNVMKGYYNRPEATAEAIKNGWFHTGDIATMDERGYVYIVDRAKEMIIRGGYNVYPREIEEVMMTHPAVVMVAVLGVPDDYYGEEIKAYVVTRNGFEDGDSLCDWTRERLADYKYPRQIEFRDSLPLSATGKLLKRLLKEEG